MADGSVGGAMSVIAVDRLTSWVARGTGAAEVIATGRLGGSSSGSIHSLQLTTRSGLEQQLVAKVFDRPGLSEKQAAEHVNGEATNLQLARSAHLPAPDPLIWDATAASIGAPVIVMSRLPGIPLPRPTVDGWIEGLAGALDAIAEADVRADDLRAVESWRDPMLERPGWFDDASLWDECVCRVEEPLPLSADRFIHRDFHTLNVLWDGDRVSGVVDWVHACRGPVDYDIASCRVNIALTAGLAAADRFTEALGDIGRGYDRAWDLDKALSLCAYVEVLLTGNDLGAGLTLHGVQQTLIEVCRAAVRS